LHVCIAKNGRVHTRHKIDGSRGMTRDIMGPGADPGTQITRDVMTAC